MMIDFVKMHGLGNDFVLIDDFSQEIELSSEQVALLCDRRFGIGADGVILVRPSQTAGCTAYMHYVNSDGSLSAMCGNGVRCFAKYLVDRGYVNASSRHFVADTLAGQRPVSFEVDEKEKLSIATVDMGIPEFVPEKIPTALAANATTMQGVPFIREAVPDSPWKGLSFTCVSMGNPHAVCFIEDWSELPSDLFYEGAEKSLESLDLPHVGRFFEGHPVFPEKANIEFASVSREGIRVRVFERGCGETLACGTGACATVVAASLTGRSKRQSTVFLRGGSLQVLWDDNNHVMMTGTATEVYSGSIDLSGGCTISPLNPPFVTP